ncbi:hypothetical protein [Peribacillus sp. NPDC097895]|uniref:hypothetical protein n=1 Tax=Peribacillus sp. NPDC097895 TaxID=3390619 RepID=UPI003D022403
MFYNQYSSLQSWFLPNDSTAEANIPLNDDDCTIYLRIWEYIFENGDISAKTPDLSANYAIYRFFDKNK